LRRAAFISRSFRSGTLVRLVLAGAFEEVGAHCIETMIASRPRLLLSPATSASEHYSSAFIRSRMR
jgi:hypothetical protein